VVQQGRGAWEIPPHLSVPTVEYRLRRFAIVERVIFIVLNFKDFVRRRQHSLSYVFLVLVHRESGVHYSISVTCPYYLRNVSCSSRFDIKHHTANQAVLYKLRHSSTTRDLFIRTVINPVQSLPSATHSKTRCNELELVVWPTVNQYKKDLCSREDFGLISNLCS
jgi:hypothetical protein